LPKEAGILLKSKELEKYEDHTKIDAHYYREDTANVLLYGAIFNLIFLTKRL